MSAIAQFIAALKEQLPAECVLSDADTLQASSHDTWPLSTKLKRIKVP